MTDILFYATLPLAPSVNHYWRTRVIVPKGNPKGAFASTYISAEGVAYQKRIKDIIAQKHKGPPLKGRLAINALVHFSDRRKQDLDNRWKALLDALTHSGLIEDDSQFDAEFIRRGEVIKGGSMLVQIVQDTQGILGTQKEMF